MNFLHDYENHRQLPYTIENFNLFDFFLIGHKGVRVIGGDLAKLDKSSSEQVTDFSELKRASRDP